MGNLDLKFYWAVFLRRLPYFLVIVAFLTAIGVTVAMILPPVYTSSASMLVEPQQIPGDLAQTTVPVDPFEQAQIIEQRLMTRANLLALAKRDRHLRRRRPADVLERPWSATSAERITFIGFVPDVTRGAEHPRRHHHRRLLRGADRRVRQQGRERARQPRARGERQAPHRAGPTTRCSSSSPRSTGCRASSSGRATRSPSSRPRTSRRCPTASTERRNRQILEQERLLALEREEAALKNQRATVVWVFERTGRSARDGRPQPGGGAARGAQERADAAAHDLRRRAARASACSKSQVAALEALVEEQRAARAVPGADGSAAEPASGLDLELAPIDARLQFIQEDKAAIEKTLAELDRLDPGDAGQRAGAGRRSSASSPTPRTSTTPPSPTSARPRSASASRCSPRASASR